MELGVYSFGDITTDPTTGRRPSIEERYAELLAAAKLAEDCGLHMFGVGEHHRHDIPLPSPAVVMAAIAATTKRIRLTSAVTILPTLDPVRVFQDFATADVISNGRVEIIAGRGAFTESFPLFGHDVAEYDALFAEKLGLLRSINEHETLTWEGKFRPALREAPIPPRPKQKLPIWLGVGGTPESAQRAGNLGMPLILANIMSPPAKFVPQIADYRERHKKAGHDPRECRVALATHVHVAKDSQAALDDFYPYYAAYFREHAPRKELMGDTPRSVYDTRASMAGPIFVGSPQQIVDKLMHEHEMFGFDRFLAQVDLGGLPYAKVAEAIELLATKVLPQLPK